MTELDQSGLSSCSENEAARHEDAWLPLRKRLKYRSWHCGMRELDFLFGHFADEEVDTMSAQELEAYETLLATPNPDLFGWITGADAHAALSENLVAARLLAYRRKKEGK